MQAHEKWNFALRLFFDDLHGFTAKKVSQITGLHYLPVVIPQVRFTH